jgi:hypothetical protein
MIAWVYHLAFGGMGGMGMGRMPGGKQAAPYSGKPEQRDCPG